MSARRQTVVANEQTSIILQLKISLDNIYYSLTSVTEKSLLNISLQYLPLFFTLLISSSLFFNSLGQGFKEENYTNKLIDTNLIYDNFNSTYSDTKSIENDNEAFIIEDPKQEKNPHSIIEEFLSSKNHNKAEKNSKSFRRELQYYQTSSSFSTSTITYLTDLQETGFFTGLRNQSYYGFIDRNRNKNKLYSDFQEKKVGPQSITQESKVYLFLYSKPRLIDMKYFKLQFMLLIQDFDKWFFCSFSFSEELAKGYSLDIEQTKNTVDDELYDRGIVVIKNHNQRVSKAFFSDKDINKAYTSTVNLELEIGYVLNKNTTRMEEISYIYGGVKDTFSSFVVKTKGANSTEKLDYNFMVFPEENGGNIIFKVNLFSSIFTMISFIHFIFYRKMTSDLLESPIMLTRYTPYLFLLTTIWHGMASIYLTLLVTIDELILNWFIIPLFLEVMNFFRSHNLLYILINSHVSNIEDNSFHSQHIRKYFAKLYLISILWLVFFFFKMHIFLFYIKDFMLCFSVPCLLPQILLNFTKERRNRIKLVIIFLAIFRLYTPLYFNFYSENFFHFEVEKIKSLSALLFFSLQVIMISLQYHYSTKQIFPCCSNPTISYKYFKKDSYFSKNKMNIVGVSCSICLLDLEKGTDIELSEDPISTNDSSRSGDKRDYSKVDERNIITGGIGEQVFMDGMNRDPALVKVRKVIAKAGIAIRKGLTMPFKLCAYTVKSFVYLFKSYLCCCYFREIPMDVNTKIMVTPCSHIFHTDCLNSWMEQKEVCPICRSSLPEVD